MKITYTEESRRDMDEIWNYIALTLRNVPAAERVVERIMDAVDQLESFPAMGTPLASITNVETTYRFLVCGQYVILYLIGDGEVTVDRILYGRRDYLRILFGDMEEEAAEE